MGAYAQYMCSRGNAYPVWRVPMVMRGRIPLVSSYALLVGGKTQARPTLAHRDLVASVARRAKVNLGTGTPAQGSHGGIPLGRIPLQRRSKLLCLFLQIASPAVSWFSSVAVCFRCFGTSALGPILMRMRCSLRSDGSACQSLSHTWCKTFTITEHSLRRTRAPDRFSTRSTQACARDARSRRFCSS